MEITEFRLRQIIDEFCIGWGLDPYRICVATAIQIAKDKEFSVSIWRNGLRSKINWEQCIIQIAIPENSKGRLSILWDLLHEIGHLLTGRPKENELIAENALEREEKAWDIAWNIVIDKMPSLQDAYNDFNNHKKECLRSYRDLIR